MDLHLIYLILIISNLFLIIIKSLKIIITITVITIKKFESFYLYFGSNRWVIKNKIQ
jgi:hypothetical protein